MESPLLTKLRTQHERLRASNYALAESPNLDRLTQQQWETRIDREYDLQEAIWKEEKRLRDEMIAAHEKLMRQRIHGPQWPVQYV